MEQLTNNSLSSWAEEGERRPVVDTAIRGLLAVGLYVAFPPFSDIHRLWERANGLNPSWPEGVFEYPPIAYLYFQPLAALPSSRWAVLVNGLLMVAAAVTITWLLIRFAERHHHNADVRMWVASPALLLFLPINWDVAVTLIALMAVLVLYRSRAAISGMLEGIGTAFKIFPGVLVLPLLPLIEGWRRRILYLVTGFSVLAASYALYAAVDPDGWRYHLEFASTRVDTESTIWGILGVVLGFFGVSLSPTTVSALSTVALALAVGAVTVWAARVRPDLVAVAAVALSALLLLNKTFKPQYVIWVLPFFACIAGDRKKIRVIEYLAILQFVIIYFSLPGWMYPLETAIRVPVLTWLVWETVRRHSSPRMDQPLTAG